MASNDFVFLDRWSIPHPIEAVWEQIVDSPAYPEWWGEVYDRVEATNDLASNEVGARALVEAHGRLPYRLRFEAEITRVEEPFHLGLSVEGDLSGSGLWTLSAIPEGTDVTFEWRVRADKPIVRWLSPLLKPLFAWNHRWTMERGEAALVRRLDRRTRRD